MKLNLLLFIILFKYVWSLNIIHYNDAYDLSLSGHFENYISSNRSDLLIFSGDTIGPSRLSDQSYGAHMIDFMNYIKVDYATLGNHEFDYGIENAIKQISRSNHTKWIISNLFLKSNNQIQPFPNTIQYDIYIDPSTNKKYGLIGLVSNWLNKLSIDTNNMHYINIRETIDYYIQLLKYPLNQYQPLVDHIIVISHCTKNDDKIIAKYYDIDLVLGGHEHIFYSKNNIIKSGFDFKGLSYINFINRTSYNIDQIIFPNKTVISTNVSNIISKYIDHNITIIGSSQIDLKNNCRDKQCLFGKWFNSVVSDYFDHNKICLNPSVVINAGLYRFDTISKGNITSDDINSLIGFKNNFLCLENINSDIFDYIKSYNKKHKKTGDYLIYLNKSEQSLQSDQNQPTNIILPDFVLQQLLSTKGFEKFFIKHPQYFSNNLSRYDIRNVLLHILKTNIIGQKYESLN